MTLIGTTWIPSFLPQPNELKPLTDYGDYITSIRRLTDELADEIRNNVPPQEAMGNYNKKLGKLQGQFIGIRTNDYLAVRVVEQKGLVEANHEGTNDGSPRHTDYENVFYDAPAEMIFDTHDPNIQSSYGDCHPYLYILDGGRRVQFQLTARARHNAGSNIKATPIIVWKINPDEVNLNCRDDFNTLQRLADDRL
jgi:hypothetical protein